MTIGETIGNAVSIAVDVVVDIIKISFSGIMDIEINKDILSSTVKMYEEISSQLKGIVDDIASVTSFVIDTVRASFSYVGGLTSPISNLNKDEAYQKGVEHINALLADDEE
jgi:prophage DNA circulation protein